MRNASFAVRSCRIAALVLVALFAVPPSGGSGADVGPAVAPTVTATAPADGATGVDGTAVIEVRFAEPMNASSLFYAILPADPTTIVWPSPDVLHIVPTAPGLSNCTLYRVDVRVDDVDEGLPLARGPVPVPWSFLTTCTRPWIVSTVPADGDGNVRFDADVVVTFSEPMDIFSVQVQFSPSLPAPGRAQSICSANCTVVTIRLTFGTRFLAGQSYTATASGRDLDGNDLVPSPVPNPWTFTVNDAPTVSKPTLSATGCLDGGTNVLVTWSMGDDLEAVADLTVRLRFRNGSLWQTFVGPAQGFSSPASIPWNLPVADLNTRVRVEVNDSSGGLAWNESDPFRIDTGPPQVVATNPADGALGVPIEATITISFSEPMARASVEDAITAIPPLPGFQFSWTAGDAAVTILPGGLPDRTPFLITIARTAQDTCGPGRPMGVDVSFSFTTARAAASPPSRVFVITFDESSITVGWTPVTTFVTGSPIPPTAAITYKVFRGSATDTGELVTETAGTAATDSGLRPETNYTYRIVAVVDGVESDPTAPLAQRTRPPFLTTSEGRLSILVSLAAVAVAIVLGAEMRRRRLHVEADAQLTREVREVVGLVRKVRTEADPAARRAEEEALQAHFRGLVEGEGTEEGAPHPRLEGLYRALAEALVHSPEVDVSRGRASVNAQLGALAANLRQRGVAYRLLSEAEASVQSELFPGLPESARKALTLVYFYALEEYLSHRLRGLVPAGATLLLGERGHINVRRKGWEQQWAGLTLGNLLYVMDRNRQFFIGDQERWEGEVEPLLRQAVEARNRTAHPSRQGPPLDRVRALVYGAMPAIESILKWPTGPAA